MSMVAGKYNIICQQGSTFDLLMTLRYPDPDSPELEPVYLNWDLTGYTARMHVRKYVDSALPLIVLTTSSGDGGYPRIVLGGTNGTIQLFLRAEDTRTITTSGFYDLEIISPSNEVDRIVEGTFTLSPEVTR